MFRLGARRVNHGTLFWRADFKADARSFLIPDQALGQSAQSFIGGTFHAKVCPPAD